MTALGASACAATSGPGSTGVSAAPDAGSRALSSPSASEEGPVESYRAWLAASRVPDVDAACAALAPELQERMISELNAGGAMRVGTCEEMIAATAELYRALGQSADVDIVVQGETATDATLFVTYLSSGDCGTIVMTRAATAWIITERSEECVR